MNIEKAKSLIEAAFSIPKSKLHRGAIPIPSELLDMMAVAKAAIETEEEENDLYDNGLGCFYESLISFCWQSLGPCVWQSGLGSLQLGEDAALMIRSGDSWDDQKGIAFVKSPSSPAAVEPPVAGG